MSGNPARSLADVHPKSLKAESAHQPKRLGFSDLALQFRGEHGQALEWALDKSHINDKTAALSMGYTNQAVISNWKTGKERFQLDTLRAALGEEFFVEFLLALAATCEQADVSTSVTLRRRRSA